MAAIPRVTMTKDGHKGLDAGEMGWILQPPGEEV